MSKEKKPLLTVSFVSQKGGVGKSTLARLFAVGAAHRGHRTLLADFDLEQLTCVEWNATRLNNAVEPDIDARAFKSLKKLHKSEEEIEYIVVDTRGLADSCRRKSPRTATSCSCRRAPRATICAPPSRWRANSPGTAPKVGWCWCCRRSDAPRRSWLTPSRRSRTFGFDLLAEHWPLRDGFQTDLDAGRAGRESRNPYLREIAERMEAALFKRAAEATSRS